jgi:hypothetical protein
MNAGRESTHGTIVATDAFSMNARLLGCARLGGLGELRSFLRPGPPAHLAFEILQDGDGRAWTLRVPLDGAESLRRLLGSALDRLSSGARIGFDEQGMAALANEEMGPGDEVVALALTQDDERRFALWRREMGRLGWSWTLDALFVPFGEAPELCRLIGRSLDQLAHEGKSRLMR